MARTDDERLMTEGEGPGTEDRSRTIGGEGDDGGMRLRFGDHARIAIVHRLRVQTLHLQLLKNCTRGEIRQWRHLSSFTKTPQVRLTLNKFSCFYFTGHFNFFLLYHNLWSTHDVLVVGVSFNSSGAWG